MSKGFYNLDGVREELTRCLNEATALKGAWEKVEITKKKDGTEFANVGRAIHGARYNLVSWAAYGYEKELTVTTWADGLGYASGRIYAYTGKETDSAEILRKKIDFEITRLEENIAEYTRNLDILDQAYNNFKNAYAAAVADLSQAVGERSHAFYCIKDTITERYPYC